MPWFDEPWPQAESVAWWPCRNRCRQRSSIPRPESEAPSPLPTTPRVSLPARRPPRAGLGGDRPRRRRVLFRGRDDRVPRTSRKRLTSHPPSCEASATNRGFLFGLKVSSVGTNRIAARRSHQARYLPFGRRNSSCSASAARAATSCTDDRSAGDNPSFAAKARTLALARFLRIESGCSVKPPLSDFCNCFSGSIARARASHSATASQNISRST